MYNNNYNQIEHDQNVAFNMMNNVLNSKPVNSKTEEKDKNVTRIQIEEIEFPKSSIKSFNTTIGEQCQLLTSIFKKTVKGYVGCRPELVPNITGGHDILVSVIIDPNIMNSDNSKEKISLINDSLVSKDDSESMIDKLKHISNYNRINRFSLSGKAKSVLKDFCKDVNKCSIIVQPTNNGDIVIIKGLEFNRIISVIYGKKSKELGRLEYDIILTNHSDLRSHRLGPANMIISIQQINEKEVSSLREKLCINYYNNNGLEYI